MDRKYSMGSEEKGKCPKCRIEYDRRIYSSCPLCEMRRKLLDKTKESMQQLQRNQDRTVSYLRKGDEIELGELNGNAIAWIVLDTMRDKALLLAKYGLSYMSYNNRMWPVSWEKSSLRKYLNDEIIYYFFSEKEQSRIIEISVENKENFR